MSAKELMETFKNKTSEEITNYLYKRLEASHVLMPRGIRENASGQDQDTTELSSIISSVNAEATPEYTADSEPKFARALDAPEDLDPPMLLRLLFASAGLRECMGFLGCCPVMEYMATVARAAPPKAVCGRVLNDEQAYRCLDCQHDDSSIFCIDCFEPAKHVGHKYFITRANGVCDCGDANALNPAGFCEHHKGVDPDEDLRRYFPTTYMRTTRAVLRALCMYAAAHVADHASDDALAVFCVLYVLVRSLGYGFASVLGDALTEPFDATPRDPRCALYAGMLAEYKDSPYALSLLWDVVFYNPLVPIRTRKYANKMLFEMISIPDFKQKFTVVFVSLYRVMVLHRARLFPVTKKKKENAHHKNKEGEEEEEEEYEEEYVEGESDEDEDDDDNGIRQFSVQLISSKGSCGKALEDLKFFKTIFDVLYEVLSKCKLEGAPYIDPDKLNSSTISVLCTSCYDTRYGLQQVSGTGVDTFYRSPTTRGTLTSMYRALSLLQGACPNKLITKGFASRKANVNSVLQAELYWATAQDDVVNGFRKLTPPEKVNILGWVLAEMWHQMVDVHPSYLKNCRLVPIAAEPVGKLCPVVIYDITSEGASFVDPLNTLTTRLIMAALQDLDDMAPVFQEAAADIADASFSSSGESGEHSTDMTPEAFAQGLLEAPLRSLACSGQIEAMHWVRNGEVLHLVEKLVRRSPTFGDAFGLNDFRTLQLCAALLPRDLFVLTVLDRFGVAGGPRRHPALISVYVRGLCTAPLNCCCWLPSTQRASRALTPQLPQGVQWCTSLHAHPPSRTRAASTCAVPPARSITTLSSRTLLCAPMGTTALPTTSGTQKSRRTSSTGTAISWALSVRATSFTSSATSARCRPSPARGHQRRRQHTPSLHASHRCSRPGPSTSSSRRPSAGQSSARTTTTGSLRRRSLFSRASTSFTSALRRKPSARATRWTPLLSRRRCAL